ncbi:hypothetical protein J437_LFUL001110 [Ladona fulva]|uniref:Ras-GEF domain-containing protein n=1 Tax=Ladona fulva TaxID=123851 RepID=A0A8K0JX61_LADFU|nr:hypothetical protein J437_LFUL001110 [Ladona fulva]
MTNGASSFGRSGARAEADPMTGCSWSSAGRGGRWSCPLWPRCGRWAWPSGGSCGNWTPPSWRSTPSCPRDVSTPPPPPEEEEEEGEDSLIMCPPSPPTRLPRHRHSSPGCLLSRRSARKGDHNLPPPNRPLSFRFVSSGGVGEPSAILSVRTPPAAIPDLVKRSLTLQVGGGGGAGVARGSWSGPATSSSSSWTASAATAASLEASEHAEELESLQRMLHFPEEVALRLAVTERKLFREAPPEDYLRHVTLDTGPPDRSSASSSLQKGSPTEDEESSEPSQPQETSVHALVRRFTEVSSWVTHLIITQPTHEDRKAVLSCILRLAISCWNIGNFNGAMEILAGLKSGKLKPFWLSISEREGTLPTLEFLSASLLNPDQYEAALKRALAIPTCRPIPFFGAFLKELTDLISTEPSLIVIAPRSPSSTPAPLESTIGSGNTVSKKS